MKLLVVVVACLLVTANATFLDDLLKPLKAIGDGVKATFNQVVPYTQQLGKQLLKDTTKTAIAGLGQGITALITNQISKLFGKRDLGFLHNLVSEASEVKTKIHQYEELLEHEFNSVAAGGHVGSAVHRLDAMVDKVYSAVKNELERFL